MDCIICVSGNIDVRGVMRDVVRQHLGPNASPAPAFYRVTAAVTQDVPVCAECRSSLGIKKDDDPVSHPAHYRFGKLEVIEVIEDWGWGVPFCLGNAIKYIARAGRKDPSKFRQDLEKARWYLDRAIEAISK
ncbi:MAG: DUF3310 domain-containing protein [Vicinamibacteria bacterium]